MSQENELTGEPKNTYVNSLILVSRQIEYNIYFAEIPLTKSLTQLKGLIHMLDAKSKEKLKDVIETIDSYERNTRLIRNKNQIWGLYSRIMDYLHETYLKECRFAKPRHKSGKLEV